MMRKYDPPIFFAVEGDTHRYAVSKNGAGHWVINGGAPPEHYSEQVRAAMWQAIVAAGGKP